ncbi:cation diffusion facilitator family transporter [Bacillota bacterium LX-D]|nr:cation diffusion facilitator family transporter [Bacillota bacterium LX-D]
MDPRVKAARFSVISNFSLALLKFIVALITGSVSILSEAIHSSLDLLAALIAFFCLRQAIKPANEKFQFGHGKIENVSGVVEALLIFFAALWIIFESYQKFVQGSAVESVTLGIFVMAFASLVNYLISLYLFKVAEKTDSIALKADAMHLKTDVLTSIGVLGGLVLIKVTGIQWLDPLSAIAIAILIIKAAIELTLEAFSPLLDVRLPEEEEEIIISIIRRHSNEFIEFHKLRSRKAGAERHIDLHMVVPYNQPVVRVHEICDQIENEIAAIFPCSHVLIHMEPCKASCIKCDYLGPCAPPTPVPENEEADPKGR